MKITNKQVDSRIAFLGAGKMAEALINGLTRSGLVKPSSIIASDVSSDRISYIKKKFGIKVTDENDAAVENSDVIFFCVKPRHMEEVLEEIGQLLKPSQLVISIAAGVTTGFLEKFLHGDVPVVRAMPNTPALVGEGATAVSPGKWAGRTHVELAMSIFSTVGLVIEVPEEQIDAVTALSGSGPAYVFYLAEAMERAGVEIGLDKHVAEQLARRTIHGAGKMLFELQEPASELRMNVTSPGGTTEAAIKYLERINFLELFGRAVKQAHKRSQELKK